MGSTSQLFVLEFCFKAVLNHRIDLLQSDCVLLVSANVILFCKMCWWYRDFEAPMIPWSKCWTAGVRPVVRNFTVAWFIRFVAQPLVALAIVTGVSLHRTVAPSLYKRTLRCAEKHGRLGKLVYNPVICRFPAENFSLFCIFVERERERERERMFLPIYNTT